MKRVILVTGAHSLADSPDAEAWARAKIATALARAHLLIVGDAPGPDAWAFAEAMRPARGLLFVGRYTTRGRNAGWVMVDGALRERMWTDDVPPRRGDPAEMTRAWFLLRNVVMVGEAASLADKGHAVTVLALLDGRKALARGRVTRGTEHTVGLSRTAGLTVDTQTWGVS